MTIMGSFGFDCGTVGTSLLYWGFTATTELQFWTSPSWRGVLRNNVHSQQFSYSLFTGSLQLQNGLRRIVCLLRKPKRPSRNGSPRNYERDRRSTAVLYRLGARYAPENRIQLYAPEEEEGHPSRSKPLTFLTLYTLYFIHCIPPHGARRSPSRSQFLAG